MVNLNRGKKTGGDGPRLNRALARRLLTAACVAGALALVACDDGMETGKQAANDAGEAARLEASAGQPRGTDALIQKVSAASDLDALQKQAAKDPALYK